VSLNVYDMAGQVVRTLVNSTNMSPGQRTAVWRDQNEAGEAAASGIYLLRLEADGAVLNRKMLLLR